MSLIEADNIGAAQVYVSIDEHVYGRGPCIRYNDIEMALFIVVYLLVLFFCASSVR